MDNPLFTTVGPHEFTGILRRCLLCNTHLQLINERLPDGWTATLGREDDQRTFTFTPHKPGCQYTPRGGEQTIGPPPPWRQLAPGLHIAPPGTPPPEGA